MWNVLKRPFFRLILFKSYIKIKFMAERKKRRPRVAWSEDKNYWNEEWKDIVFGDDVSEKEIFKVSNYGRILNCKAETKYFYPVIYTNKYQIVQVLLKSGKRIGKYVHKIVAEHFLERKEDETYVIHLDFNKDNNKVENLKWVNKKGKFEHQAKNPNMFQHKTGITYSKLTETQVKLIKRKINNPNRKTRMKMIAKQYGISEMQLYRIKTGENWGHVTE